MATKKNEMMEPENKALEVTETEAAQEVSDEMDLNMLLEGMDSSPDEEALTAPDGEDTFPAEFLEELDTDPVNTPTDKPKRTTRKSKAATLATPENELAEQVQTNAGSPPSQDTTATKEQLSEDIAAEASLVDDTALAESTPNAEDTVTAQPTVRNTQNLYSAKIRSLETCWVQRSILS